MPARKTAVTHPDGTVSTRSSKTMTYTHAVEIGPADPELAAQSYERHAAEDDAQADALELVLANKPKMRIRSRKLAWPEVSPMVTHEAWLVGTEEHLHPTWCNAEGTTEHGYPETVREEVGGYLLRRARSRAEQLRASAGKLRAQAAEFRAAGAVAGDGWGVLRWSTRADLADKQRRAAERTMGGLGRVIRVVQVDAVD